MEFCQLPISEGFPAGCSHGCQPAPSSPHTSCASWPPLQGTPCGPIKATPVGSVCTCTRDGRNSRAQLRSDPLVLGAVSGAGWRHQLPDQTRPPSCLQPGAIRLVLFGQRKMGEMNDQEKDSKKHMSHAFVIALPSIEWRKCCWNPKQGSTRPTCRKSVTEGVARRNEGIWTDQAVGGLCLGSCTPLGSCSRNPQTSGR